MTITPIMLFDLDGVLLQPIGYRTALKTTITHFLSQMAQHFEPPSESDYALFESLGITSEWDMAAISLAIALNVGAEDYPFPAQTQTLHAAITWVRQSAAQGTRPPYTQTIHNLRDRLIDHTPASEAVLSHISVDFLPVLLNQPFARQLLGITRDVKASPVTCFFQALVLGSTEFEGIYHLKPSLACESALKMYDQPLIEENLLLKLRTAIQIQSILAVALTARGSLPPRGIIANSELYTPEAEIALGILGLADLPMISYGRLAYVAERHTTVDHLVKPAAFQALAAILTAWSGSEIRGLELAWEVSQAASVHLPAQLEVHIFEDSPIGIRSTLRAAEALRHAGANVTVHAWGIAHNPHKSAALQALGAQVFPDINQALPIALSWIQSSI